ncbi:hypothetical protein HOT61_gp064 [Salmonella phage S116]|uniref:Uncharacterized protein n=8 Tax=Epseptimavirus TaxID=2732017 RepID=A0A2Z5HNK0_9CAUD|nr:hypothetical protein BOW73_gp148 [Salmonella phage 100268_sal2]YP_009323825.1 hypothetical protein BOX13_gp096 [Salmonella phage 118970_sal2]YP_009804856.1 hypothetical protein HOT59_gp068 [Salmonella phage S113]YP_009805183.1 hypothetical protein HOT61_gp064 [Salmonella phage S116]YP_009805345.1 hypothetical protein HOT62_gp067 [Salmonella phage S126]YP_009858301.1 hypothetical protein HWD24_gp088 [Salmonella phage rokbiter]QEG07533.1 hypothetical protein [Salmonella phage SE3]QEI24681.1
MRKRAQSPRQIRKANIGEPETRLPPPPEQRLVYLDEELAERERKAQEEIERKKLCTAPAYNKGGYQYVSSEEQAKMIGR